MATADGKFVWTKFFSSCDTPNACGFTVILNECWGVQARGEQIRAHARATRALTRSRMSQALSDGGAVLGCGTGIENCEAEGMTVEVARVARAVRARLTPPPPPRALCR